MDSTPLSWHTEQRTVASLIPFDGNPRQLNEKQVADLKRSLEKFNLVEIPAINTTNKILAGHQRLKIMQLLGRGAELIDVRVPNRELTPEEEREYLIRSNKNTGDWDWDQLANFDAGFLVDCGFTTEELTRNFGLDESPDQDEAPDLPAGEARAKRGQVFTLGRHRIMCGDSTDAGDVALLMDGKKADMVFTDPPYNVQIDYGTHKDDYSESEHIEFSKAWFGLARSYSNQVLFTSGLGRGMGMPNIKMWYSIYPPDWMIIWVKKNAVGHSSLGGFNNWEPILFYGKAKKKLPQDIFDVPITVQKDVADKNGNKLHPTPKSRKLWTDVIEKLTDRDDVLYEPFTGSGTTLIACEQTGRICYGMELDPKYVDVIIHRYCEQTKTDPEVIYAGATAADAGPGPESAGPAASTGGVSAETQAPA